jgi:hypothetical protein
MDALARLAPVARPLLADVDAALNTVGAPASHPIWRLLGRVGATPADVVGFVADLEPSRLRSAAAALREQERSYADITIPTGTGWEGRAAGYYAATAAALRAHLADGGPESLAGRLRAVASYVESVAEWQQRLRDDLARLLAQVMTSSEAVTLRLRPAGSTDPDTLTAAVGAAADIGAALLGVAVDAAAAGHAVVRAALPMEELPYHPSDHLDPAESPIRLP